MLPGGAAAEVPPGDQDGGALVGGGVEFEVRVGRAVGQVAPGGEEEGAEAGALDALPGRGGEELVFQLEWVSDDGQKDPATVASHTVERGGPRGREHLQICSGYEPGNSRPGLDPAANLV